MSGAVDALDVAICIGQAGPDFAVDDVALVDAVRRGATMNFFFLPLVMKVDLFMRGSSPFDESEFARRQALVMRDDGARLWIKSAEDSILRKLAWYVEGGGVSERQWRDVVAMLRVSGPSLDARYLDRWAVDLGLQELLERAVSEAGAP